MNPPVLTEQQKSLAALAGTTRAFVEGHVGTGKTTAGVAWLDHLFKARTRIDGILVVAPQRSLLRPYEAATLGANGHFLGRVQLLTIYGLARRSIDLFWPLIAEEARFVQPDRPPTFLTIETAQYFMAKAIDELISQGYFDGISLRRNRIYSQILDNMNKAAIVGFPHTEFGKRLKTAWVGDPGLRTAFDQAQECANCFREYCLEHNLLDFSLQMEIFTRLVWDLPLFQEWLLEQVKHLIVDNIEEDTPAAHDLLLELVPSVQSALILYDLQGGHRTFLGADPHSALRLKAVCSNHVIFQQVLTSSDDLRAFGYHMAQAMNQPAESIQAYATAAISLSTVRFSTQILTWAANEVAELVHSQGVSPSEIAVLAPFMPDVLRFSLTQELEKRDIPYRTHRPSRPLKDKPAARTLMTLAHLAHPQWRSRPKPAQDVASAFKESICGMDLTRAYLLAAAVYSPKSGEGLKPFGEIATSVQQRITFRLGERYEILREWISAYVAGASAELDHFLARIFGEVLSQPGFGFAESLDTGKTTANLIESVQKFRWVAQETLTGSDTTLGMEYVTMVEEGIIAATYQAVEGLHVSDAVLLSPAFTFLMRNRPVDYQFWLNVNSSDWWRRIYQPLTHPYVLSRNWQQGQQWQDADEATTNNESLYRLTQGLILRCRKKIYLGFSDIGAFGWEERGPLMRAIQRVLVAASEGSQS